MSKNIILLIVLLLDGNSFAQKVDFLPDIKVINNTLQGKKYDQVKRPYIYKDERSVLRRINPLNLLSGGALYVYQNSISRHLSASCLYTPSCSDFGKEAIRDHGLLKGMIMTAERINRCNRISGQDLKHYTTDVKTNRYPDPVSRYNSVPHHHGN